jgi:O-antigen ligase
MQQLWQKFKTQSLEILLLLYVFLLPWSTVFIFSEKFLNGVKWEPTTGVIYATEILLWLIFLAFLIKSIRNFSLKRLSLKNLEQTKVLIVVSVWLLVFFAGLSLVYAGEPLAVFYLWLKLIQAGVLFFIIVSSNLKFSQLALALTLSAGLQGLLAIYQFLTQQIIGNKYLGLITHRAQDIGALVLEAEGGRWLRAYGSFNDPNFLGGWLALGLLSAVILYTQKKYQKILPAVTIIIAFGLFFTFSRGALIAFLFGLIIFLITSRKIKPALPLLLIIFVSWIILGVIFSPLINSRLDNNESRLNRKSNEERLIQLETATNNFKSNSLVGVGFNNYSHNLYLNNPNLPTYAYRRVENIYLLILNELGVIGLSLLLLLFIAVLIKTIKEKNFVGLSLIATLLTLGLFYHYPLSGYQGLTLFFLILALGLINNKK